MNFRYYITDVLQGCILGTNSLEKAEEFSQSDDYFVVDSVTGDWLYSSECREPVLEVKEG